MLKRDDQNSLWVEDVAIADCVDRFGTPLYVYSEAEIRSNIHIIRNAVSKYFKKWRISYAVKANSNPHLLHIFREEGLGVDCSSPAEVAIARQVGFPRDRFTYTGNYESFEDLQVASDFGVPINLDDYRRLDDLLSLKKPDIVSFRINPGKGRGGFEGIMTGGTDAKFGIPYEDTRKAYKNAIRAGIKRFGIHMMTGSNILEPLYFAEITQKLMTIAGEALGDLGIQLEFVDIGGGFGIPYTDEEAPMDLENTFKHIADIFYDHLKKYDLGNPELIVEPGRFLIGNAGVLVSRVTHVKHSYRSFVGIDGGMNVLLRPALYKAYHRIWVDKKVSLPTNHYFITGQVCENSDIHPEERELPEVEAGDIAVVLDAGAYGYAMSSNYNNRPRPAEIVISGREIKLVRRAETIADLFRLVPDFEFEE